MKKSFIALAAAIYCATCFISLGEEPKRKPEDALIDAARAGDVVNLKDILDHGADIDAANRFTETALMNAADAGKIETLNELLVRGAKIDTLNKDNRSAFFFATFMGHESTALELLKAGAKFDVPDKSGYTPLMAAAQHGLTRVVDALLERCVDVNTKSRWGSAILLAASSNSTPMVSALIAKGADVNVTGENHIGEPGWTPLHYAALNKNLEMTEVLVKAGANLNAVRKGGLTPLLDVSKEAGTTMKSLEFISLLVQLGANIDAEDDNGDTALTMAGQKGQTSVVNLLIQHGAKKQTVCVNVSPYPVKQPLPPEKRWALASTALLTQRNRDSHELLGGQPVSRRENARALLFRWWNVKDRHDTIKTLGWLNTEGHRIDYANKNGIDPNRLLGWDYSRFIFVAGKAYVAGYLSEKEAWELIAPVAQKLQATYHSWKEMGESYLLGRSIWGAGDQPEMKAVFQLLINPNDPNSPWNTNAWDTPLGGVEKPDQSQ